MAGEKLLLISKSLSKLVTEEHPKVRREIGVYCDRLLTECHQTMQPSVSIALDMLLALSHDSHPLVEEYCAAAARKHCVHMADTLRENFATTVTSLPRVLNNVDSAGKLTALNMLYGYIEMMLDSAEPQTLTAALSTEHSLQSLVGALLEAASVDVHVLMLVRHNIRDGLPSLPVKSPWLELRLLAGAAGARLWAAARLLGGAACASLLLDRLPPHSPEAVALANQLASAPNAPPELAHRVLRAYTEESVWYLPLDVLDEEDEAPAGTCDPSVYDPRAWTKDSVPGLFEGGTECRCTGVSYLVPRAPRRPAGRAATLGEAQRNVAIACLLTEGVGLMARRLGTDFQPYLLKTLSMILERVGSIYEMLHLAGVKAINDIATACGHASVPDLIRCNADYFTHQVSVKLKKAWSTESALQILSVVMQYSDASILDCVYGIVEDVLVQSLDKYHEKNLLAYLRVFPAFITCIRKWYLAEEAKTTDNNTSETTKKIDVLKDLMEYLAHTEEMDRLMKNENAEKQSAEEMFIEDQKLKEEGALDYDDKVTEETPPLPRHIIVTRTVLRRCINFLPSKNRREATLAFSILKDGMPILSKYQDELLPLVHQCWAPLAARCADDDPYLQNRALDLLVTIAALAKDFLRQRAVTEALPHIYAFLHKSARESYLKDAGSAYRNFSCYNLQTSALEGLASLAVDLALDSEPLQHTMACVGDYLSRKQPKPLQELAVKFFKTMLEYDYGATWYFLRKLADNEIVLHPPDCKSIDLVPIIGTPYSPTNKDLERNLAELFEGHDRRD